MATFADFIAEFVAITESWSTRYRLDSDWRDDMQQMAPGETSYQLRVVPGLQILGDNSNLAKDAPVVNYLVHHRLLDAFDERVWTEGQLLSDINTLAQPKWWRAMQSVYDLEDDIVVDILRDVNVVTYDLTTRVSLAGG